MTPTTKPKQRLVLAKISQVLWRKVGHLVAYELHCLDYTIAHMHNRTTSPRARSTSVAITPTVEAQIRYLHQTDPTCPQHEIATLVGTNQGRVNETLIGKRA